MLQQGVPVFRLFVLGKLVNSNAEARRLIRGGGARINDEKISDEGQIITDDALCDGVIKLSSGRKNHILIRCR